MQIIEFDEYFAGTKCGIFPQCDIELFVAKIVNDNGLPLNSNALSPIVVNAFIVTLDKLEQPANAYVPTLVTPFATTLVIYLLPANAPFAIVVVSASRVTAPL